MFNTGPASASRQVASLNAHKDENYKQVLPNRLSEPERSQGFWFFEIAISKNQNY
ncbi:MAG: hypothetical protein ABIG87_00485 [Patescibacteria group bacterium]